MLNDLQTYAVLPASDIQRARTFYSEKLGLEPAQELPEGVIYRLAGGSQFLMYETSNAGTAKNTAMCWMTDDLESEMSDLRRRGVTFEDYDFPGLKTENGVATNDTERSAWFVDSEGNILCISQEL